MRRNKPSEIRSKESILENHLSPAFGCTRLRDITAAMIEDYVESKTEDEYSPKTINNQLAVLGRLLRCAKRRELIDAVPEMSMIRTDRVEADFLTYEEAQCLVDGAEGQLRNVIILLIATGLRIGELRALRWADVNFEAAVMRVRHNDWYGQEGTPKSGRARDIPLNDMAMSTLKEQKHRRSEYVFCYEDGTKFGHNTYARPLWGLCDRLGMRRITWHVLRHTFASHLLMHGVAIKVVADLLGHSATFVTERYGHVQPSVPREAVTKISWQPQGNQRLSQDNNLILLKKMVEQKGIEPSTSALRTRRSPS